MIGFLKCLRTYNSVASNIKNNNKMLEQTGLENKRNFLKNITENFGSLRPVWSRNHVTTSCVSPLLSLGFSTCKSGFPHGNNTGVSCRSIMQEVSCPGPDIHTSPIPNENKRIFSQHFLLRSFREAWANNFLHVIGSPGLHSHPTYQAGHPNWFLLGALF